MANLALPPTARREGNLPAEVTTFVGRRRELADLRRLLERSRLVTITGVGGVGKTRLALRLAAEVRRGFSDGVWMVELSSAASPQVVPHMVTAALGLSDRSAGDAVDVLTDHLADRHALLILDTCEHVLDACALLTEVLLRAAPRLRILSTSRQSLDVAGEHCFQLAPLTVPDPSAPAGPGASVGADSIELFTERAGAVLNGFALTAGNRVDVARLCHRLEGIPLAIELAVFRLRALPLTTLVERLDDRFKLLGTARTGRDRHHTMHAAIDWSHDLCTGPERLLWARLSAFPGDFDLPAAEAVCADDALLADQIFTVLAELIEKSIVQCDRDTGRYWMLDTIREYGLQWLDRLGERDVLRLRHCGAFRVRIDDAARRWRGDGQAGLFAELHRELPNLRAAFDYCLTTPDRQCTGLEMIAALDFYWAHSGQLSEGYDWLGRALGRCPAATEERAWALRAAAIVAGLRGDADTATGHIAEAERIAEGCDRPVLSAHVTHARGLLEHWSLGPEWAQSNYDTAISIYEVQGYDQPMALACLVNRASVHIVAGEFERALALCDRCIRLCKSSGDLWCRSLALWMRAVLYLHSGDLDQATTALDACLRIKEGFGDLHGIAMALDVGASIAAAASPESSAALFGASDALWRLMNAPPPGPSYHETKDSYRAAARQALGDQRFAEAHRHGSGLSVAEAIALARGKPMPLPPDVPNTASALTKREREIAELVTEGLSNREIAERLVIAKRTADSHLEHILAKLGFTSRTQIAAWVTEHRTT